MKIGEKIRSFRTQNVHCPIRELLNKQITPNLNKEIWGLVSNQVYNSMWVIITSKIWR